MFHAKGQTDSTTKLIVAFGNFAKAPKNVSKLECVTRAVTNLN